MKVNKLIDDLMNNTDPEVRRDSALKLVSFEATGEEVIRALVNGVEDRDRGVSDVCSRALSHPPNGTALRYAEMVSPLICSERIEIRNVAADILRQIGGDSLGGLMNFVRHPDKDIRQFAIENIGKIGWRSPAESIIEMLDDECDNVRNAAIEALGNMKAEEAVGKLIDLYDKESDLCPTIIEALGKIGGCRAQRFLVGLIKNEKDTFLRIAAIDALAFTGEDIELCRELMQELHETMPELQVIILKTIYAIAFRVKEDIYLPQDLRYVAHNALKEEDLDLRSSGLIALGTEYSFDDLDSLVMEVIRKNIDTQQIILMNLLENSHKEVIREFFVRYSRECGRDTNSIEFLSFIIYPWDNISLEKKEAIIEVNTMLVTHPDSGYTLEVLDLMDYLKNKIN